TRQGRGGLCGRQQHLGRG
ncbi:uncharacterized protein WCI35_002265, partial [Daubentonia madagascariensis]